VLAAAVGPVTAGPLVEVGVHPVQPERYRLGALVRLVTEQLERRVVRLAMGDVLLELRGQTATVSGRAVPLAPRGLALLRALAASDTVVSRRELRNCLRDGSDDHALEVAMSRLRGALAVPGLITTVVKRGYRLNAIRLD
jgi:uroporphyrinogen-III synthase